MSPHGLRESNRPVACKARRRNRTFWGEPGVVTTWRFLFSFFFLFFLPLFAVCLFFFFYNLISIFKIDNYNLFIFILFIYLFVYYHFFHYFFFHSLFIQLLFIYFLIIHSFYCICFFPFQWDTSLMPRANLERLLGLQFPPPGDAASSSPGSAGRAVDATLDLRCCVCYSYRFDDKVGPPDVSCNNCRYFFFLFFSFSFSFFFFSLFFLFYFMQLSLIFDRAACLLPPHPRNQHSLSLCLPVGGAAVAEVYAQRVPQCPRPVSPVPGTYFGRAARLLTRLVSMRTNKN